MRLSEVMKATVIDRSGRSLGPVRDIRLATNTYEVIGVVVGAGPFARAAHAWGYAEGRAEGPWLLKMLTRRAVRQARFAASGQVADWGPEEIRLNVELAELTPLMEALRR